jgi:hypothetical protein
LDLEINVQDMCSAKAMSKDGFAHLWSGVRATYGATKGKLCYEVTGKSLSEALIFTSTNPQYDDRLFIALQVQYMKIASSEHVVYINCSECQKNQL